MGEIEAKCLLIISKSMCLMSQFLAEELILMSILILHTRYYLTLPRASLTPYKSTPAHSKTEHSLICDFSDTQYPRLQSYQL